MCRGARRGNAEHASVVEHPDLRRTASPYNFNGLVRHYYLRRGPNVADIQVNLLPKDERDAQSHEIAKHVRLRLQPIAGVGMAPRSRWPKCRPDRRCSRHWSRKSTDPSLRGGSHWRGQVRSCSSTPASWTSIGTSKTTNRRYRCSWMRRRPPSGISEATLSAAVRLASDGGRAGLFHDPDKEDVSIMVRLSAAARRGELPCVKLRRADELVALASHWRKWRERQRTASTTRT